MGLDMSQDRPLQNELLEKPALPPPAERGPNDERELTGDQRKAIILIIVVMIVILAAIIAGTYFLFRQPVEDVARIRDIFIIFMAIQSLLMGLALVVLLVQLARLINLLQNEIKPILDSTSDTINSLRGTTVFLSDNLVQPVIKLNQYLAGFTQMLQVVGLVRRSSKKDNSKGE